MMEDFKNRYQQQQQCPALRTPQQGPPVREGKRRQVRIHKVRMFASGIHISISDCWESQNSEAYYRYGLVVEKLLMRLKLPWSFFPFHPNQWPQTEVCKSTFVRFSWSRPASPAQPPPLAAASLLAQSALLLPAQLPSNCTLSLSYNNSTLCKFTCYSLSQATCLKHNSQECG